MYIYNPTDNLLHRLFNIAKHRRVVSSNWEHDWLRYIALCYDHYDLMRWLQFKINRVDSRNFSTIKTFSSINTIPTNLIRFYTFTAISLQFSPWFQSRCKSWYWGKRKISDSVLWQKPLRPQTNPKRNVTTQKRHQNIRLHNDCGPT